MGLRKFIIEDKVIVEKMVVFVKEKLFVVDWESEKFNIKERFYLS